MVPFYFTENNIDHIIPESTEHDHLKELIVKLELPPTFTLDCPRNLVPTHHGCNARKRDHEFSEVTLRYYFEMWEQRQEDIERRLKSLQDQSQNERLLTRLASRIETGFMSIQEVTEFLTRTIPSPTKKTSEPLVICFGVNIEDLYDSAELPEGIPDDYVHICDWLEQDLIARVREFVPSLSVQSEASGRNGETLSVRIAFWNLDVALLEQIDLSPWEVLEIASFSEIYDDARDELFPRAVVQTYHDIIHDKNSKLNKFHLAMCPQCASSELEERMSVDHKHDEVYYIIECKECGWSDWTQ